MRLIYLKKSTKFSKFKSLKHYNSYGYIQECQYSPSSTPLIRFHLRKMNGCSVYSMSFLSCFGGRHYGEMVVDEKYSFESASAIVEVHGNDSELLYGEEEDDLVDEKAERFIERFYEEMKRQRRESLSAKLPLNRLLEY